MEVISLAFLKEALTYVEPDPIALMASGVERDRYVLWHRRLVNFARAFGLLFGIAVLCILIAAPFLSEEKPPNPIQLVAVFVLGPLTAFLVGCIFGATIACLIAPRDFLLVPLGRKWMGFIGTENIFVAKIAWSGPGRRSSFGKAASA